MGKVIEQLQEVEAGSDQEEDPCALRDEHLRIVEEDGEDGRENSREIEETKSETKSQNMTNGPM